MRDPKAIERLKTALERNIKAIELRPTIGRGTAVTKVSIRDGCTAEIEDGGWKLIADESIKDGGNGEGPDPGVYGRAALGACVAMGYAMWAAVKDVPVDRIEVEVEADYDASGMFGLDDGVAPGWHAMRYNVLIESTAPEDEIQRLIDYADAHSSLLDSFVRAVPVRRELRISAPAR